MDSPPTLLCPERTPGPVTAEVRDPAWQAIAPLALAEVVTGATPQQPTALRVARAGADLRVLFDCTDAHPWATFTERDAPLYREETVEVFLDPFGDLECYFEIELNPLNTVLDLVVRKSVSGLRKDFAWRCDGLRTAVARTAHGWSAELAIPFESLLPGAGERQTWRVNFTRIDRAAPGAVAELTAWSPTGLRQFHAPSRFGSMRFGELT